MIENIEEVHPSNDVPEAAPDLGKAKTGITEWEDNVFPSNATDAASDVILSPKKEKRTVGVSSPRKEKRNVTSSSAASASTTTTTTTPGLSGCSIDLLHEQGYTRGLIRSMEKNRAQFPLRIWIVDNSLSSMSKRDGHMIDTTISGRKHVEFVKCTRWDEIQQTVDYHSEMAALLESPTIFRLIDDDDIPITSTSGLPVSNKPKSTSASSSSYSIAEPKSDSTSIDSIIVKEYYKLEMKQALIKDQSLSKLFQKDDSSNNNNTPLTKQEERTIRLIQTISNIRDNVISLLPMLQGSSTTTDSINKRIVIVLATDGQPTTNDDKSKQDFINLLQTLKNLPIWIIVRLCTDEDHVVSFWNSLDVDGLDLEVIDDFVSESKEVSIKNSWLTYALPLHRMREMGFHDDIFDLLDERTLNQYEIYGFCKVLYGSHTMKKCPTFKSSSSSSSSTTTTTNITKDEWLLFCDFLHTVSSRERTQWNPITKKVESWINVSLLETMFDDDGNIIPTLPPTTMSSSSSNKSRCSDARARTGRWLSKITSPLARLTSKRHLVQN